MKCTTSLERKKEWEPALTIHLENKNFVFIVRCRENNVGNILIERRPLVKLNIPCEPTLTPQEDSHYLMKNHSFSLLRGHNSSGPWNLHVSVWLFEGKNLMFL